MEEKYKSVEERIFVDSGVVKGIQNFVSGGIQGSYSGVASYFRLPTSIRKLVSGQTLLNKEGTDSLCEYIGTALGLFSGFFADIAFTKHSLDEMNNGNYIPLAVLGATNVASLCYELGRFSKSKQEYLEMKKERAEKSKKETEDRYNKRPRSI